MMPAVTQPVSTCRSSVRRAILHPVSHVSRPVSTQPGHQLVSWPNKPGRKKNKTAESVKLNPIMPAKTSFSRGNLIKNKIVRNGGMREPRVSVSARRKICICVCACRLIPDLFSIIPPVSFQVWCASRWLALTQSRWETRSGERPDFSRVLVEPELC